MKRIAFYEAITEELDNLSMEDVRLLYKLLDSGEMSGFLELIRKIKSFCIN